MDFSASKEIWRFFSQFENPLATINELIVQPASVLYPNPSNGNVWWTSASDQPIQITDLQGRAFETKTENGKLSLGFLPNGTYLLRSGNTVERLVIEQ
jgi:hypothetical protein